MEVNVNDIVVERIYLRPDDNFGIRNYTGGSYGLKKFYIPGDEPFSVDLLYSKNPALNHEKIAYAFISSGALKKDYEEFSKTKDFFVSYKDFLIYKCEAASVSDVGGRSKAQVVCGETHVGTINRIVGEYIKNGYKLIDMPQQFLSVPSRY